MSNVLATQFVKSVQAHLAANAVDGACVTRTDLAKVVRKLAGKRTLDTVALNAFISASVNLGFFDSEDGKCGTKRGVQGGITYEKTARKSAPRTRRASKLIPELVAAPAQQAAQA